MGYVGRAAADAPVGRIRTRHVLQGLFVIVIRVVVTKAERGWVVPVRRRVLRSMVNSFLCIIGFLLLAYISP